MSFEGETTCTAEQSKGRVGCRTESKHKVTSAKLYLIMENNKCYAFLRKEKTKA
jgi:hypothetical protein